ncbi:MAG: hypothetical protein EOO45_18550 [Flavobacterium sp.]|nr:MAG: hypothetical protein EOO45_18550 [Flavobacterium sp.]
MEEKIQLLAVQNFERSKIIETLFFTEWDDAIAASSHTEAAEGEGFDYTCISLFEIDEEILEDTHINDIEALEEIFRRSPKIEVYYFN